MPNCQKCGASLPAGATVCEYCDSVLEVPRASVGGPAGSVGVPAGSLAEGAPQFKRGSIAVMLLCTVLSLGFYISLWYFLRRESLKALNPEQSKRTNTLVNSFIGVHGAYLALLFTPDAAEVAFLMWLVVAGMNFYMSFFVRGLLRAHAERTSPGNAVNASIAASLLWTFLFSIFYLQTQIDRMIDLGLLKAQV